MTQAKVLFDDVTFFRNLFISIYFIFGQFSSLGVFSHYAIFDFIEGQKVPIRFSGVPFIGACPVKLRSKCSRTYLTGNTFSIGCLV